MSRYQPGIRVGAIQDADDKNVNLFGYGVYDGDLPCELSIGETNPRISLDNGEVVWGCQCWWGPEEKIRALIGERHVTIVPVVVRQEDPVSE